MRVSSEASREGGYASEGFARRSVWRGATGVSPWGSTSEIFYFGSKIFFSLTISCGEY